MNRMIYDITKFLTKISDSFPIIGGGTGAVIEAQHNPFPTWESIVATIIVAVIGAVVGYLVKIALDKFFGWINRKKR